MTMLAQLQACPTPKLTNSKLNVKRHEDKVAAGSLAWSKPTKTIKNPCKLKAWARQNAKENEGEFRVGSRVIQIARAIWQDCTWLGQI